MLACAGGAGAWGGIAGGAGAVDVFCAAVDPKGDAAETGLAEIRGVAITLAGAGALGIDSEGSAFFSGITAAGAAGDGATLGVVTDSFISDAAYGVEDSATTSSYEVSQSSGGNAMPQTLPATSNSSPI